MPGSRLARFLIGLILCPFLAWLGAEVYNRVWGDCANGGAESAIACTLREGAIVLLAIPAGLVAGLALVAMKRD